MIIQHPDLPPIGYTVSVWRYMPINRFFDLLKTQRLYFRRTDCYEDQKEATLTELDEKVMHTTRTNNYWKQERRRHYVSCWIEAATELSYMWAEYSDGGIAIESSSSARRYALYTYPSYPFNSTLFQSGFELSETFICFPSGRTSIISASLFGYCLTLRSVTTLAEIA